MGLVDNMNKQPKRVFFIIVSVYRLKVCNRWLHTFFFPPHNILQTTTFIRYDTKSTHNIDCRLCLWCSSQTLYAQFRQILNYAYNCIFLTSIACGIKKNAYLCNVERIKGNAEVRPRTAPQGYRQAPDKLRTLTTSGVSF